MGQENEGKSSGNWKGWGGGQKKGTGKTEIVIIVLLSVMIVLCAVLIFMKVMDRNTDRTVRVDPTPSGSATEGPDQTPGTGTENPTPTSEPTPTPVPPEDWTLVEYTGRIEHIFTHSLLAFPELSFPAGMKPESIVSSTYFIDCITVKEFKMLLEKLYQDGYMLVNANDIYEAVTADGITKYEVKSKLMFPQGKKPLILSFDDVNYYSTKQGKGMVGKLILDDSGKVVTYTKMKDGSEVISDDNEHIPILDRFVAEHPDFSFNGAKGMLCLTGYDGILGYRTNRASQNREAEIAAVQPVIQALKNTGWYFASHSYKHGYMTNYSVNDMKDCAEKFRNEVVPLIGETKLYVFPYGDWGTRTKAADEITAVRKVLVDYGFTYFAGVGIDWYSKTRNDFANCILQDRANIDGTSLLLYGDRLQYYWWDNGNTTDRFPHLNTEEIYDAEGRGGLSFEEAKIYYHMNKYKDSYEVAKQVLQYMDEHPRVTYADAKKAIAAE